MAALGGIESGSNVKKRPELPEKKTIAFLFALGVIALLGGVFFLLAASQVLPSGINSISSMGVPGKVVGGTLIAFGAFVMFLSSVLSSAKCGHSILSQGPCRTEWLTPRGNLIILEYTPPEQR